MGRAPCCDKENVKRGPWSPEEDEKLKDYIEKHGTGGNWIALPQKIVLKRCGKSCRLRWLNYLRPNIKHGGFTEEEDNIICSLYISIGSRWSVIAAQLPGRTDNDIKNYWNTRLKKKLFGRRRQSNTNRASSIPGQDPRDINVIDQEAKNLTLQNLSNKALERLQLHMHLQSLQNPLSFYDSSSLLWPNLIQTLSSPNENQNTPERFKDENPINSFSSSGQTSFAMKNDHLNFPESEETRSQNGQNRVISSGFTQVDLDDLLNVDDVSPVESSSCFKETDGLIYKESAGWWSNEFDASSAPLNETWGLVSTMIHDQSGEIYQDYATTTEYNNMQ